MKFQTQADAFTYYRDMPDTIIEARAQAIRNDIANNAECDIDAYNMEIVALKAIKDQRSQARPNVEQRGTLTTIAATNGTEKAEDVFSTPTYRSAFFGSLMGRELTSAERDIMRSEDVVRRSNEFNSSSNSAAVLPTTMLNEVIEKARTRGGVINVARSFNMPTGISVPVAAPGNRAAWHVEGATVETTKVAPVSVTFGGNEIMAIRSLSAKVDRMSIPAFESYIVNDLAQCVMDTVAYSLVNGTGADDGEGMGVIPGVTWTDGTNQITVAADKALTYDDVAGAVAMLKADYCTNAAFAMSHKTLFSNVYTMTDEVARPLYIQDIAERGKGTLLGFPVVIDNYLADGEIVFGDFSLLGFNLPNGIAVERSTESGFRSGTIDFRCLAIADTQVIVPEAFTHIVKASE